MTNECEWTSKSKKKTTIESHYWMWNVDESQEWNFKLLFIFSYHFIKQWYHISLWRVVNISRLWLSCDFSIIFDFLIPKQNGFSIIWFERTLWRLFLKGIVRTHRDIPTCFLLSQAESTPLLMDYYCTRVWSTQESVFQMYILSVIKCNYLSLLF